MRAVHPYDLLIVGAGPVGLACAVEAQCEGLSYLVIEKDFVASSLLAWSDHLTFFSTPERLEIGSIPFVTVGEKPTRDEGIAYYQMVADRLALDIHQHEQVSSVKKENGLFIVTTDHASYWARNVIFATGYSANPRRLNVPGEDLPNVHRVYRSPYPYFHSHVTIIGAKSSAIEAALELSRNHVEVTMIIRRHELAPSVKYWLRPNLENRIAEGRIKALFDTEVREIKPRSIDLRTKIASPLGIKNSELEITSDFVLALIGYDPDYPLLQSAGVYHDDHGCLRYDPSTMQTDVPGLFLAGPVAAGQDTGSLFIENGRDHAHLIMQAIGAK